MLAKTFGSALIGIDAITITIEVDYSKGINFFLVGKQRERPSKTIETGAYFADDR